MLILGRKVGDTIQIGPDIEIMVARISDGYVRIGITAPHDMNIMRGELLKQPRPAEAACDVEGNT